MEMAFCFNYGNWKLQKVTKPSKSNQHTTTTIYKCLDCSAKLIKTAQGQNYKEEVVTMQLAGDTQTGQSAGQKKDLAKLHHWFDKKHQISKYKRKRDDTPLHPCVKAILTLYQ